MSRMPDVGCRRSGGRDRAALAVFLASGICLLALRAGAAPTAPPCTRLSPGKGIGTLFLYQQPADDQEERKVSAAAVRLCELEEKPKALRFHVHVEWLDHTEGGDYWIPTSEIAGPGGIRPDTPIVRPGTFPAGTLAQRAPRPGAGVTVVAYASRGSKPPAVDARPDREQPAEMQQLMTVAVERYAVAVVMQERAARPGRQRPAEETVRIVPVEFTTDVRTTPDASVAGTDAGARAGAAPDSDPAAVKRLQWALNRAGARLKPDGVMGLQTSMALADYQRAHGLKPTGWLDPTSRRLLGLEAEGGTGRETVGAPWLAPRPPELPSSQKKS